MQVSPEDEKKREEQRSILRQQIEKCQGEIDQIKRENKRFFLNQHPQALSHTIYLKIFQLVFKFDQNFLFSLFDNRDKRREELQDLFCADQSFEEFIMNSELNLVLNDLEFIA